MSDKLILVINTGSSSLKFGLYTERDGDERVVLSGLADGVGRTGGKIELKDDKGRVLRSEKLSFASQDAALDRAARWLTEHLSGQPDAIGHRVVHGGPRLLNHQLITPDVIRELRSCVHFAPLHIPMALRLIETSERNYPNTPQFACFDTAFHKDMPETAARFALPGELFDQGIRRYGFHGLSYESILHQLGDKTPKRTVIAHLGNGASLAAVLERRSVDTSMGLTPTGGIPMSSRSGDLDPGVILYLMRAKRMTADSLEKMLNHESGLTGLSGGKGDMRDLEAAADAGDARAKLAIEIFCNAIRNTVSSYAAVLGGLDLFIFAGGIGEHSARVRSQVCQGLEFLGVGLDGPANRAHEPKLSTKSSKIEVRVVPSEEDRQIARHCRRMMQAAS